jgi:hypothetical protein
MQPDVAITLDVLHLVFSAFGFVHKIATFEKQAGLQALVQFDDTPTAEQVSISPPPPPLTHMHRQEQTHRDQCWNL